MKRKQIPFTLIAAVILLVATGCKKTDQTVQPEFNSAIPITSQSVNNQVAYGETNLKKIGVEIAKLAQNKDFVNFVHTEAAKKFDQEYEVLIEDLKNNKNWAGQLNSSNLNNGLNAFKNIAGASYYPQIYIPKLQADEDKGKNFAAPGMMGPIDSILYVYYAGDPEVDSATNTSDSYPAYYSDASGNMHYWGMVNEDYADQHEVWVISLNESVNYQGKLILPCPPGEICDGGGGTIPPGGEPDTGDDDPSFSHTIPFPDLGDGKVNCEIQNMIVRDGKESWLAGASEISIRAKLHTHNDRAGGNPYPALQQDYHSINSSSSYTGYLIRKFKRHEIKNGTVVTLNYHLETDWQWTNYLRDPVYFDYVIFEKDVWPAKKQLNTWTGRTDQYQNPTSQAEGFTLHYRSGGANYQDYRQFYYVNASICNNPYMPITTASWSGNTVVNIATIGYNTINY